MAVMMFIPDFDHPRYHSSSLIHNLDPPEAGCALHNVAIITITIIITITMFIIIISTLADARDAPQ